MISEHSKQMQETIGIRTWDGRIDLILSQETWLAISNGKLIAQIHERYTLNVLCIELSEKVR